MSKLISCLTIPAAVVAIAASVTIPAFAGGADFAVTINGTRADLAFDAAPYARAIYLVWGAADAGRRTNGWDNVAADTYAASLFGKTPDDVPHIKIAAELGVGCADLAKIKVERVEA